MVYKLVANNHNSTSQVDDLMTFDMDGDTESRVNQHKSTVLSPVSERQSAGSVSPIAERFEGGILSLSGLRWISDAGDNVATKFGAFENTANSSNPMDLRPENGWGEFKSEAISPHKLNQSNGCVGGMFELTDDITDTGSQSDESLRESSSVKNSVPIVSLSDHFNPGVPESTNLLAMAAGVQIGGADSAMLVPGLERVVSPFTSIFDSNGPDHADRRHLTKFIEQLQDVTGKLLQKADQLSNLLHNFFYGVEDVDYQDHAQFRNEFQSELAVINAEIATIQNRISLFRDRVNQVNSGDKIS